jgi:hypothetical protein
MTATVKKIRDEEKKNYKLFLDRSKQFYETIGISEKSGRWAAVGLNAVHCAISMNDALTVYFLLKRSISEDHRTAADLLSEITEESVGGHASNYKRILAKKNAVAYEGREFRESEAQEVAKQAERFYQWGLSKLPKQ